MFAMLLCGVEAKLKGIADACMECLRQSECLAERQNERRKASGFLTTVKDRLLANEARVTQNSQPAHRRKR